MSNVKTCIGTYDGEEIVAKFSQPFERDDYGVPGSPVFFSPTGDVECYALEILGVSMDISDLPALLQFAIMELADDVEWVSDEGE